MGDPTDSPAAIRIDMGEEAAGSPEGAAAFLSSLPAPLDGYGRDALPAEGGGVPPAAAADRIDALEVSVRTRLLELASDLLGAGDDGGGAADAGGGGGGRLLEYLRAAMALCVHLVSAAERLDAIDRADGEGGGGTDALPGCYRGMGSPAARKLPFLLLEDTVDSLPPALLQALWTAGVPDCGLSVLVVNLCASPSFTKASRFVLLKACNKLLRKLSNRDRDAAFAGEVMTLLSTVFPLSERSAVNVLGTFNVTNVTECEDEETFLGHRNLGADAGATDGMEVEDGSSSAPAEADGNGGGVDYAFYSIFWGVHKVFTDPTVLMAPAAGKPGEKAGAEAAAFDGVRAEAFIGDVRTVLAVLEGQPFTAEEIRQSKSRWQASRQRPIANKDGKRADGDSQNSAPSSSAADDSSTSRHHKYLTNSQLLHLQLGDPEMRIHFLTQFLIVASYLSSAVAAIGERQGGAGGRTKATEVVKSLATIRGRAEVLLRQTPPNGQSHLRTVEWILSDRETMWRKWKANRCQPAIEAHGMQKSVEEDEAEQEARMRRKRKLMMAGGLGGAAGGDLDGPTASAASSAALYSYRINLKDDLPGVARALAGSVPPLFSHLDEYIEALDPENGIEADYHPRNDKPFAWRAMRLLARDHLGRFGSIRRRDGDFERVVRAIWSQEKGTMIPGEEPEEEDVVDLDELVEKERIKKAEVAAEAAAAEAAAAEAAAAAIKKSSEDKAKEEASEEEEDQKSSKNAAKVTEGKGPGKSDEKKKDKNGKDLEKATTPNDKDGAKAGSKKASGSPAAKRKAKNQDSSVDNKPQGKRAKTDDGSSGRGGGGQGNRRTPPRGNDQSRGGAPGRGWQSREASTRGNGQSRGAVPGRGGRSREGPGDIGRGSSGQQGSDWGRGRGGGGGDDGGRRRSQGGGRRGGR